MADVKQFIRIVCHELHAFTGRLCVAADAMAAAGPAPIPAPVPAPAPVAAPVAVAAAPAAPVAAAPPKPGRKKKGVNADGTAKPKRPLSAYNIFMKSETARLKATDPDMKEGKQKDVFAAASEAWGRSYLNVKSPNYDKERTDAVLKENDVVPGPAAAKPPAPSLDEVLEARPLDEASDSPSGKRSADEDGSGDKKKSKKSKKSKD